MTGNPKAGFVTEQGPEWLVNLLFNPPLWFRSVFYLGCLVALALAARGLASRDWELDEDVQLQMLENGTMIVSILVVTLVLVFRFEFSYEVDVALGWFVGVGISRAIVATTRSAWTRWSLLEEWSTAELLGLGWVVIGLAGFVLPNQLAGRGAVPLVSRGGLLLLVVAAVLGLYNLKRAAPGTA